MARPRISKAENEVDAGSLTTRPRGHSIVDSLPFLINRVGLALAGAFSVEVLAEHELSIPIWRVIAVLADHGEQRQIDLAELTSVEPSAMSHLVTRIARMGLVSRRRSRANNREVTIRLTAKGQLTVGQLRPLAGRYQALIVEGMSESDLGVMRRLLRVMYEKIVRARAAGKLLDR